MHAGSQRYLYASNSYNALPTWSKPENDSSGSAKARAKPPQGGQQTSHLALRAGIAATAWALALSLNCISYILLSKQWLADKSQLQPRRQDQLDLTIVHSVPAALLGYVTVT